MAHGDGDCYSDDFEEICTEGEDNDDRVSTITIFKSPKNMSKHDERHTEILDAESDSQEDEDNLVNNEPRFGQTVPLSHHDSPRGHIKAGSYMTGGIKTTVYVVDDYSYVQSPRTRKNTTASTPPSPSMFYTQPLIEESNDWQSVKPTRLPQIDLYKNHPDGDGVGVSMKRKLESRKLKTTAALSNESLKSVKFTPNTKTNGLKTTNKLPLKPFMSRSLNNIRGAGSQDCFSVVGVGQTRGTWTDTAIRKYQRDRDNILNTRTIGGRPRYGPGPPLRLGPSKPAGNVGQRVASAKRMTVNDLKNKIGILSSQLEELRKENRSLKYVEKRQQNAIKKWEGKDADLPRLLQQHKDDLHAVSDQLRKSQAHCRDMESKLRNNSRQITKMELELQRLKSLASQEELLERTTLQNHVDTLSSNLTGAEARLRHYMRHIEILEKNHNHQMANEQQKLIKANNHSLELRQEITRLKLALRDKDRMLNYIQMRSTGRNLLRAFQDDERKHSMKYATSENLQQNSSTF